jgi:hypothetical protein
LLPRTDRCLKETSALRVIKAGASPRTPGVFLPR